MDLKLKFLRKLRKITSFNKRDVKDKVSKLFKPKCYQRRELVSTNLACKRQIAELGIKKNTGINSNLSAQNYEKKMRDQQLEELMKDFVLTESQIKEVYKRICLDVKRGLAKDTHEKSDIKCFITYVHRLPTGKEKGKILALDLGGTNFRVLLVTLKGPKDEPVVESTIYAVSKEHMTGTGTALFDHIAECLAIFVKERGLEQEKLPLGFTFSFPCKQIGLESACLSRWTKGYSAEGVVDEDIGRLLNEALARRGDVEIELTAIVNDTTGTLMSCAYRNPNCRVGVIVGTGCNSCYVERTENAELLSEDLRKKYEHVIINTEWGAFGDSGTLDFIRTDADRRLDETSINRGSQIYEKMISGMYLGDLVRYCLIKAVEANILFNLCPDKEAILKRLQMTQLFETLHLSSIEADKFREFTNAKKLLTHLFHIQKPSLEDCQKVKYICECISKRAATLAGIGVSGLVNKIEDKNVTIGVDGTLYRKHPTFKDNLRATMEKLVDPSKKFDLMISEDGSGLGAAVIAAVAHTKFS